MEKNWRTKYVCRTCGGVEFWSHNNRRFCIVCQKTERIKHVALKPYKCKTCGSGEFIYSGISKNRRCKACKLTAQRRYGKSGAKKFIRRWSIKSRYGIEWEEYMSMYNSQKGECAICGYSDQTGEKSLVIDHCHLAGHVRGLLCRTCNLGLGAFKDSPNLMTWAIDYLLRNETSRG